MTHPYSADLFPVSPSVEPAILGTRMGTAFDAVVGGIDSLYKHAFDARPEAIIEYLNMPPELAIYWRIFDTVDWAAIARPDIIVDEFGAVRIVELNAASFAVLQTVHDDIARVQRDLESTGALQLPPDARIYSCTRPIAEYLDPEAKGLLFFGLWDVDVPADGRVPHWSIQAYVEEFERLGFPAEWGAIEDLEFSASSLRYHGSEVVGIFRYFDYGTHIGPAEIATLERLSGRIQSGLRLLSSFIGEVIVNKSAIGLLGDEQLESRWPSRARERALSAIPWTRLVADATATYRLLEATVPEIALRYQSSLVLKPVDGSRGQNVLIGLEHSREAWKIGVKKALETPNRFVLQEYVGGCEHSLRLARDPSVEHTGSTVYSPFFLGRRLTGALRRTNTSSSSVVSATNGAVPSPVFWIGPEQHWEQSQGGALAGPQV